MPSARRRSRGLLIAAEGLDGSGKSAELELLARWLERKGRAVQTVRWDPSPLVARARAGVGSAGVLADRVVALLTAADAARRADRDVRPAIARGEIVLADRYAWSGVAREVARGVDPSWIASVYTCLPPADLIIYHRLAAPTAMQRALADRPESVRDAALATAFAAFLARLAEGYERLLDPDRADAIRPPWPAATVLVDAGPPAALRSATIRDSIRPLIGLARVRAGEERPSAAHRAAVRPAGRHTETHSAGSTRSADRARPVAGSPPHGLAGILLAFEGIDRSGRSTQVRHLEEHLRHRGIGVIRTSLATSLVAGDAIRRAKRDRALRAPAMALLYAADLAERIESIVLPSLRAGLIVLADRWTYTPMARAEVRGVDIGWLASLFRFAPAPDAILYLDVPPETSLARRAEAELDPYEAGADLHLAADRLEGYRLFQMRTRACFDRYSDRDRFIRIEGTDSIAVVAGALAAEVDEHLGGRHGS